MEKIVDVCGMTSLRLVYSEYNGLEFWAPSAFDMFGLRKKARGRKALLSDKLAYRTGEFLWNYARDQVYMEMHSKVLSYDDELIKREIGELSKLDGDNTVCDATYDSVVNYEYKRRQLHAEFINKVEQIRQLAAEKVLTLGKQLGD